MNLLLKIWRQEGPSAKGRLQTIQAKDISPEMSFLELLDVVNERMIQATATRPRYTPTGG